MNSTKELVLFGEEMEEEKEFRKKPHPVATANPLSQLIFSWTLPIFRRGLKNDLSEGDLFEPLQEHASDYLGDKMQKYWDAEVKKCEITKKEPNLIKVICQLFWGKIAFMALFTLCYDVILKLLQPLLLGKLINYFADNSTVTIAEAEFCGVGIIMCSALTVFMLHPCMVCMQHVGMKLRVAVCSLVYRKALKLSKTALGQTTVGQIVNLMSNDVSRFDITFTFIHMIWVGPVQTVIVTYLVWNMVGVASLTGLAFLLVFIPLQGWMGKKTSEFRYRTAMRTDERVRLMNEIITGIQVIKMYTWEKPFAYIVSLARKKEIMQIRNAAMIKAVSYSFIIFHSRTSIFLTILSYVLLGHSIKAAEVFVITSFYNTLRQSMSMFLPTTITQLAESLVSVRRIKTFLLYDETRQPVRETANESMKIEMNGGDFSKDEPGRISMKGVTAKWVEDSTENTLNDVSIEVQPGTLNVIIGPIGSGKSSVVHAFLKELPLNSGTLRISGNVSYASQDAWLFHSTVRQNILFGLPYDKSRYRRAVAVCSLLTDFKQLPYGDKTIVGERGVSLSGGQRARINLARAVYKDADIYLLDDPLSAVDTHVGKHLFEDCIQGYLKNKTVVLITHQLQYLESVDQIVLLEKGSVLASGTYQELQKTGYDFANLLVNGHEEETAQQGDGFDELPPMRSRQASQQSTASSAFDLKNEESPVQVAEGQSYGSIKGAVYKAYFTSGGNGWALPIFTVSLFFITQGLASGTDYWLTYWVNLEEHVYTAGNATQADLFVFVVSRDVCIYVFSATSIFLIIVCLTRSFLFFILCLRSSRKLHDKMFDSITKTPMLFFNNNSSGRILNRFSKDMGSIDELLPNAVIDVLQIFITLAAIIAVCASVNVWFLVPTAACAIIFYFLRIFYISTSRSVKRLEGITRSPVFSHLNASLQGLTTIRAFKAQEVLIREFDNHQDLHSASWYLFITCSRAFGFWLDTVCAVYISLVVLSFLFIGRESFLGGDVGLAITQAIGLTGMFQWGMRQSAELENQMTSVERVVEYSDLPPEENLDSSPEKKPRKTWPESGKVDFRKLSLRYGPDKPWVVKELTVTVQPGEKVGIVGRTGAGKSSLIQALFRIAETTGDIIIDDIPSAKVDLHTWRAKISIIPQEPMLFSGTLRKNLDPFDNYSDADLWNALDEVELKEVFSDSPTGLQAVIAEGGGNLSIGQRQLLCLARAIVRNNKILILDEATANVDPRTDALIQKTIRRKFAACTVLTIAHRLNTIMDSDKILVMDGGSMVEYDAPYVLLQNSDGHFHSMVEQTGRATEEILRQIAAQTYETKFGPLNTQDKKSV